VVESKKFITVGMPAHNTDRARLSFSTQDASALRGGDAAIAATPTLDSFA